MIDITSDAYPHYSDSAIVVPAGDDTVVSDNSFDSYIQNFSYIAIHLPEAKQAEQVRVYLLNDFARDLFVSWGFFQGSNNSTDGDDGTWYTLCSFSAISGNPSQAWSDPIDVITNKGIYSWYRISNMPQSNNSVLPEWEILGYDEISISYLTDTVKTSGEISGIVIEESQDITVVLFPGIVSCLFGFSGFTITEPYPNPVIGRFIPGQRVRITAIPDFGFYFDHWEGGITGSQNPVIIQAVSGLTQISAIFRTHPRLYLTIIGNGQVAVAT